MNDSPRGYIIKWDKHNLLFSRRGPSFLLISWKKKKIDSFHWSSCPIRCHLIIILRDSNNNNSRSRWRNRCVTLWFVCHIMNIIILNIWRTDTCQMTTHWSESSIFILTLEPWVWLLFISTNVSLVWGKLADFPMGIHTLGKNA